eukprot:CAMPEP_0183764296 /NCGR_PEP_ID=MMETSP0739-20130205/10214_1 /TAXON_ID=385413 /ORGANISM="Thalassiosira miniscula, Strain CCMP1093" /LENGTH=374 /DNA_ID=CAMNT_0026002807 /DNA_START=147 /DNA_END=1274 /DNA_ORIENTATION=-
MEERTISCRDRVLPYGDDEAILNAFREDGYVVVADVLSPAEVAAALYELWTSKNLSGNSTDTTLKRGAIRRGPSRTGDATFYPRETCSKMLELDYSVLAAAVPFATIALGARRSHDVEPGSMGRHATVGIQSTMEDGDELATLGSQPLHKPAIQPHPGHRVPDGINSTSGGFACVPGFHKRFRKWGEDHPLESLVVNGKSIDETYGDGQPFPVPTDDPCQAEIDQALAPAGSMILWDSRLPHQNVPNIDDAAFRVVFYCNMMVATASVMEERRNLLVQKRILMDLQQNPGQCFPHNLSDLGNRLHGWTESHLPLSDALVEFGINDRESFLDAVRLVREAGMAEEEGNVLISIRNHRAALRAFPEIEVWHNVIFG